MTQPNLTPEQLENLEKLAKWHEKEARGYDVTFPRGSTNGPIHAQWAQSILSLIAQLRQVNKELAYEATEHAKTKGYFDAAGIVGARYQRERDELKALLTDAASRVVPGETDTPDALIQMLREYREKLKQAEADRDDWKGRAENERASGLITAQELEALRIQFDRYRELTKSDLAEKSWKQDNDKLREAVRVAHEKLSYAGVFGTPRVLSEALEALQPYVSKEKPG